MTTPSAYRKPSTSSQPTVGYQSNKDLAPSPTIPMTIQAIDANSAEHAYNQTASAPDLDAYLGTNNSDRTRNTVLSKKLIVHFMEKFNMDARQAKVAVEREMGEKYAPNPWDEPRSRGYQRQQKKEVRRENGEQASQGSQSVQYSDEQWDRFEKMFA